MCGPRVVLRTAILVRAVLKLLQFTSLWRSRLPNTGASSLTKINRYDDLTFERVSETVVCSDTRIGSALRTNQIAEFRILLEKMK